MESQMSFCDPHLDKQPHDDEEAFLRQPPKCACPFAHLLSDGDTFSHSLCHQPHTPEALEDDFGLFDDSFLSLPKSASDATSRKPLYELGKGRSPSCSAPQFAECQNNNMVFLAVPSEWLQPNCGLTQEQVLVCLANAQRMLQNNAPAGPASIESSTCESVSATTESTAMGADDSDPSRFPTCEGGRCTHRKSWKRLRAKRGATYFICLQCNLRWRTATHSTSSPQDSSKTVACGSSKPSEDDLGNALSE